MQALQLSDTTQAGSESSYPKLRSPVPAKRAAISKADMLPQDPTKNDVPHAISASMVANLRQEIEHLRALLSAKAAAPQHDALREAEQDAPGKIETIADHRDQRCGPHVRE